MTQRALRDGGGITKYYTKSTERLRRRRMCHRCRDNQLCWWCVRSWDDIGMLHRNMRNDSGVVDEQYINSGLLALEHFLVFPLYSISCIAKQVTNMKRLRLMTYYDSFKPTWSVSAFVSKTHSVTIITYHYTRKNRFYRI